MMHSMLLFVLISSFGVVQEDDLFGSATKEGGPVAVTELKPTKAGKRIEIIEDYQEGLKTGRLEQRPVVVILGATWCSWCRKLESEIDSDEGEELLKNWVVTKVDVDLDPIVAEQLEANALPAIRVIGLDEKIIAKREGYSPVKELEKWLDSKLSEASPKIQRVLYEQGEPSQHDIKELLQFLTHPSPNIRSAAIDRLIRSRSSTAKDVVQTLQTGRLIQKLSAIQVLQKWRAPIDSIDPWNPSSMNDESIKPLLGWLENQPTTAPKLEADEEKAEVDSDVLIQIEILLPKLLNTKSDALMSQVVQLGPSVLPIVREKLKQASDLDDRQHIILRELLYRLLASEKLRLEQSSLLTTLASLHVETHRAAAEKLVPLLSNKDQGLLDELSSDTNPIIRELTIPVQQKLGALSEPDRLTRMLDDKSPSVRTAILRELSEHKNAKSVQILIEYIQKETNEDLLVYATKTLGKYGTKKGPQEALVQLTRNTSWRVRAAAIDALGELLGSGRGYGPTSSQNKDPKEAAEAVIAGLQDSDSFVVARAEGLLLKAITSETTKTVTKYLMDHPEKVGPMLKDLSDYEKPNLVTPLVNSAMDHLGSADPVEIRNAATLIAKLSPTSLQDRIPALMGSENAETRIAALESLIATLTAPRLGDSNRSTVVYHSSGSTSSPKRIDPELIWHPVPESLQEIPKSKNRRLKPDETTEPARQSIMGSILGSLFGTSPNAEPVSIPEDDIPVVIDLSQSDAKSSQKPALSQEEAAKLQAELSVVDDFFGPAPALANEVAPHTEANTEIQAEVPGAELIGDVEINFFPSTSASSSQAKPNGLPSVWLQEWHQNQPRKEEYEWMNSIQDQIRTNLANAAPEADLERQWLIAASLASGDASWSEKVANQLVATASEPDKNRRVPKAEMMLPWLTKEDRIRVARSTKIQWSQPTKDDHQFLKALTLVDDLEIAGWILENVGKNHLDSKQSGRISPYILRALVGPAADSINSWIYAGMASQATTPMAGKDRAREWLHEQYRSSNHDSVRALLFCALSYVDHEIALQSAVGYVFQATESSECLNVALLLALNDVPLKSADRAVQWLQHPLADVKEKAIEYLCKTPNSFGQSERSEYNIVRLMQQDEHLPGLWFTQRELPFDAIRSYIDKKGTNAESAQILLLAANEPNPIDAVTKRLVTNETKILACAALSLAERTDVHAMAFYEAVASSFEENEDVASALYATLRDLKGPEIRALRTKLRNKHGASILRP